ncbi:MAG: hypothetical protein HY343_05500 [Lentisphaerae bacterium]|nr:hypothetical protein [Lentisphaerota bacterium]
MSLYSEAKEAGSAYRAEYLAQIQELIRRKQGKAERRRERFFRPDFSSVSAYETSVSDYRRKFKKMLGWPLTRKPCSRPPAVEETFVAQDELGRIFRLRIEALPGLKLYGLLFLPAGKERPPLVISQHGGGGTPELCSKF